MSEQPADVITVGEVREPTAPVYGAARPRRADKIKRSIQQSRRAIQHRRRRR